MLTAVYLTFDAITEMINMIERFIFLAEEIMVRLLTVSVKMLTRLKCIVLFILSLKVRSLCRL